MQSPEMSFDLLNDKISFLTQDSVDGGEDDTLDFKMSPKPMPVIAEEVGRQGRGSKADEENQEMTARPMVFSKPRKSEHSGTPCAP